MNATHWTKQPFTTRFWLEYPSLTYAEYLVNRGNNGDCSAGLDSLAKGLQMARHHHNARLEIQFQAVKAVALKCAGMMDQALELLEKTLSRAEPHGLVRSFVDRGPLMAELLRALLEKKPENPYLRHLLDAFAMERSAEKHTAVLSGEERRLEP